MYSAGMNLLTDFDTSRNGSSNQNDSGCKNTKYIHLMFNDAYKVL